AGNNFADFQLVSVGGRVFNDLTGDGFSADDLPLGSPAVTVTLCRDGVACATAVTDGHGGYRFTGVGPGHYTVRQGVPGGWLQTGQTGAAVTATSGLQSAGNDFDDF